MATCKGRIADGSDALWNGDLLQSRATSKGIIADSSYRESAKICGYGDVVGAINKGTKFVMVAVPSSVFIV